MLNYVCGSYFGLGRTNIIYSLCYFVAGGLVYQHRDELEIFSRKYQWISLGMAAASVILYFLIGGNTITMLLVYQGLRVPETMYFVHFKAVDYRMSCPNGTSRVTSIS